MNRRSFPLIVLMLLAMLSVSSLAMSSAQSSRRGRKYKAPPPTSTVNVTILRADDSKPIHDAAVIFQLVGDKGNMELKTNEEGKTMIDVLPTGSKVLLQVIAKGYQTYGQQYDIDKESMNIEVKMNRPAKDYSIYAKNSGSSGSNGGSGTNKGNSGSSNQGGSQQDSNKSQQK